ncbi:Predicted arabinose efflux permease, MFS family [Ferrithrix thermotolerans DSM 19514]|uniref:Predicted arabinose efflux permease, MFS family n=1 Tax=Ferrithrix thermotolerans DSM 19514 TaxID=1121881 RepID=A0A1M4UKQ9_9ACTN|nr:MFS transporter [Ferrithrix thermotolerans]SHE57264.1 Predicted arabinose efflux permease, MFS family [Ferrithrix thermotolerans DSM 19514]
MEVARSRLGISKTFSSLAIRNFRLYLFGQIVSTTGTWMQSVAMAWLVLRLTGSGVDLGLVTAVQFLPVLVLGGFAGTLVDRFDKRKILIVTQSLFASQAALLYILVTLGVIRVWMVFALSLYFGLVNAVDPTARQSFVQQMTGPDNLQNAVSLNSVTFNVSRAFGPALAGVVIASVGVGPAFGLNALSYLAVIVALMMMRRSEFFPFPKGSKAKGQFREGLGYVKRSPILLLTLLGVMVVGTFAYNFNVSLPLLAKFTFHGGPETLGLMSSFIGAGAVVGGLWVASTSQVTLKKLAKIGTFFAVALTLSSIMPSLKVTLLFLAVMGAFSIAFMSLANSLLQLNSPTEMRGRVMALYSVGFLGSTPIGSPITGYVAQHLGPRVALLMGASSVALVALLLGAYIYVERRPKSKINSGGDVASAVAPSA